MIRPYIVELIVKNTFISRGKATDKTRTIAFDVTDSSIKTIAKNYNWFIENKVPVMVRYNFTEVDKDLSTWK